MTAVTSTMIKQQTIRYRLGVKVLLLALIVSAVAALTTPTQAQSPTLKPAKVVASRQHKLPAVTISPLPGTPDASASTQISFLGVPAADISHVVVMGSHSGRHLGVLRDYATGEGASFLPARVFTVGEIVKVSALESAGGTRVAIGTHFVIGSSYVLSIGHAHYASLPEKVLRLRSLPSLRPPVVDVTTRAADPGLGDVFLTPVYGTPTYAYGTPVFSNSQAGPMIVSPGGQLIWFHAESPGLEAADLQVQHYLGQKVLTYWQGHFSHGHGVGDGVILNSHYQQLAAVHAGNGLHMDLHDFTLAPHGVAVVTVYDTVHWNLSAVGGPKNGLVEDCVVQEIDVRTGLVMFEWHALGHVPLRDSFSSVSVHYVRHTPSPHPAKKQHRVRRPLSSHARTGSRRSAVYDYFHINRIQLLPDGNLLINARNTWAAYDVSHESGRIIWQLGGKHSSFRLGPGVRFAWQHDTTMLSGDRIQIFDNEDAPRERKHSRGIVIALNFRTHTAKLLHAYYDPKHPLLTSSQGNVQTLANGDKLLGYGHDGLVAEFADSGHLTFEMKLAPLVSSYRAYRFLWQATPRTKPAVVATRDLGTTTIDLASSWNGATTVRAWQVLAGASPTTLHPLGAIMRSQGFETRLQIRSAAAYVAVRALGGSEAVLATSHAGGHVLATSRAVAVIATANAKTK